MRIIPLLNNSDIIEFDVQKLIDGLEGSANGEVVFEFDGYFVVDESLEEAG